MTQSQPNAALADRFGKAQTLDIFMKTAAEHAGLWQVIAARSRNAIFPSELLERAQNIGARNVLVLLEDWCGDAINTVPVMDAFMAHIPHFSLRVLSRDANDDLMQAHLSPRGAKAIPVAIVYDEHFNELGWWGSRPEKLQAWRDSEEAEELGKAERYAFIRRWYVQDKGISVLKELLEVMGR